MAAPGKRSGAALKLEPLRKKRKLLEVVACGPSLSLLPDALLLCVMSLLDVRSVVFLSRVCKRFHHLHRDESIWRDVDLMESANPKLKLDSRLLKKIISRLLHPSTLRVKLSSRWRHPIVTTTVLDELLTKCPQIQSLTLRTCNLSLISNECKLYRWEPLEELFLDTCEVRYKWAETVKPMWPKLTHLSLRNTRKTSDSDLEYFASCQEMATSLRVLVLTKNYRVSNAGVNTVCNSMPNIHTLDLDKCLGITQESIESLAKLKHLQNLHFDPPDLSTAAFFRLLEVLPGLRSLHVYLEPSVQECVQDAEATVLFKNSGVDLQFHIHVNPTFTTLLSNSIESARDHAPLIL